MHARSVRWISLQACTTQPASQPANRVTALVHVCPQPPHDMRSKTSAPTVLLTGMTALSHTNMQEARPDKQQLVDAHVLLRTCLGEVFTRLLQHLVRCSPLLPETGFTSSTQYSQLASVWGDAELQQVRGLLVCGWSVGPTSLCCMGLSGSGLAQCAGRRCFELHGPAAHSYNKEFPACALFVK
jgi:hypothetical protein